MPPAAEAVEPFTLAVPDAELEDLRARLRATRWPEPETVADWSQGIPLDYVRELCAHWAGAYDWRRLEARLNGLGQHRTVVDGVGIHLLHVRSPHPQALPLLITHGWPGSVVEFLDVLGPLADPVAHGGDPADAFHVVCPSLPGYGFSDRPTEPGWGVERIARAWVTVMVRLGYERFGAQGGDWGAMVTTQLALDHPGRLAGVHLNMPLVSPEAMAAAGEPDAEEQALLDRYAEHRRRGDAYARLQGTRPQTLGYGLVDSPAALCAWIVEKFHAWTDNAGHPEDAVARDTLLDNLMLYWLPATGASAARLYWESYRRRDLRPLDVPVAVTAFPREIFPVSPRWAAHQFRDLRHFGRPARGGHFAALEQPAVFVDEVRAGFRTMRP